MAQSKEQLEKLLDFIDSLCKEEGNEWFAQKLKERFGASIVNLDGMLISSEKIDNIEKYLGLDYLVDNQDSSIDYSFIENPEARKVLESDNREMHRYRYGTRYHKSDFCEFCRHAMMQLELILNYYYQTKFSTFEAAKEHIKEKNPTISIREEISSLIEIPYNVKFWAFKNEFAPATSFYELNHCREIRNDLSHRSVEDEKIDIVNYQNWLTEQNVPFDKGTGIIFVPKGNPMLTEIVKNIKGSIEYKKYQNLIWKVNQPYDSVLKELNRFMSIMKNALSS